MDSTKTHFLQSPTGLWRRVIIQPGSGWIGGALEDDIHRFHLRLDHADGRIVGAAAETLRHPWSACPGAAAHIARELTGEHLADVAARDPTQHCTHLYDLAVVLAAHVEDAEPTVIDMRVADPVEERSTATLSLDGAEVLRWHLKGTVVEAEGRDLRQLSKWKHELGPAGAEHATMLRRAVYVSGARHYRFRPKLTAVETGSLRMGVCYNYQLPRAETSTINQEWMKDWSAVTDEPLGGFDAAQYLAALSGE